MKNISVSDYLNKYNLLEQVLDGIDKFPAADSEKEIALNCMSEWQMDLITKSTHIAGRCQHYKKKIQLHEELLKPGRENDHNSTLLHEVGHFLAFYLLPNMRVNHGRWWKHIVSSIGGNPTRCHNYEYFKDLQIVKANHEYTCLDCGEKMYTQRKLKKLEYIHHKTCYYKPNKGRFTHKTLR